MQVSTDLMAFQSLLCPCVVRMRLARRQDKAPFTLIKLTARWAFRRVLIRALSTSSSSVGANDWRFTCHTIILSRGSCSQMCVRMPLAYWCMSSTQHKYATLHDNVSAPPEVCSLDSLEFTAFWLYMNPL
jgi:hypothetical protein